jgi:hypothetical protein
MATKMEATRKHSQVSALPLSEAFAALGATKSSKSLVEQSQATPLPDVHYHPHRVTAPSLTLALCNGAAGQQHPETHNYVKQQLLAISMI